MFYIVGLGNPGEKYKNNRHNVGFLVLDALVEKMNLPNFFSSAKYSGQVSEGVVNNNEVTMLKPETFMNESGKAVRKLVPKGEEGRLVVVYDEIDVPYGEIKVSVGRGAGGHNGIKSIIDSLGTKDFIRVRVGVGHTGFWPWEDKTKVRRPKGASLPKFVLKDFSKGEQAEFSKLTEKVQSCLVTIIESGVEQAMNECN